MMKKAEIKYAGGRPDKSWKVLNIKGICVFRGSWDQCKAKLVTLERYKKIEVKVGQKYSRKSDSFIYLIERVNDPDPDTIAVRSVNSFMTFTVSRHHFDQHFELINVK